MVTTPAQVVAQVLHFVDVVEHLRVWIGRGAIHHAARDHDSELHTTLRCARLRRARRESAADSGMTEPPAGEAGRRFVRLLALCGGRGKGARMTARLPATL